MGCAGCRLANARLRVTGRRGHRGRSVGALWVVRVIRLAMRALRVTGRRGHRPFRSRFMGCAGCPPRNLRGRAAARTERRRVQRDHQQRPRGRRRPRQRASGGKIGESICMQSEQSLIRSYGRSLNGFAAKLTEKERVKIARMEGIVSVFPSVTLELQTTRSWDFMEFGEHVNRVPTVESNTIIGVIDTGVWPELESFSDKAAETPPLTIPSLTPRLPSTPYFLLPSFFLLFSSPSPFPSGLLSISLFSPLLICFGSESGDNSWKIIGARYYTDPETSEEGTTRDAVGHGTHTTSTAAGNQVNHVSLFNGLAEGNARGAVPRSRVAIYKACWLVGGCKSDALLAAFDDAISDGVDIISISIAFKYAFDYTQDVIAIGAFHAMQHGILTSQAAGNNGPSLSSTTSIAPWIISVAASTIDRQFVDKVVLGSAIINGFDLKGKMFPLIAGYQAVNLNSCSIEDGRNPQATKLKSEAVRDVDAPAVISFSSRGPNSITSDILKPDITAPGVEIFAAWSPKALLSTIRGETRYAKYNIISGTSMACPHVSGAAAYVKTFHPHWSPSAIKSALMTTASHMNATRNSDREFAYGAGHLNSVKAIDPGLLYEAFEDDYVKMLCSIGLEPEKIKLITATVTSPSELTIIVEPNVLSFKSLNEKQSFVVRVSVKTSPQQEVVSASLVWSDGVHNVRSPVVVHYKS
ncbi:hypothetical protein Scep_022428 [Stephania cephalantha]|uniref:Cucumisin n=1 Tax=Stephania cephalantha TaxID=152367 RepID=A0AAP0I2N9_9MAGN